MDTADPTRNGTAASTPASGGERILVTDRSEAVEALWAALERDAVGSPFQARAFCLSWYRHAAEGATPLIVTGERGGGAFLLPLVVERLGPFRIARFPGGSHANFNLGLFAPAAWEGFSEADVAGVVGAVRAARPRVDAIHWTAQPLELAGRANPFVGPGSIPAPHPAFDLSLDGGFDAVLARHNGGRKRQKVRAKSRSLEAAGGLAIRRAETAAERRALLDVFFAQKAVRFEAQGLPDPFASAPVRAFWRGVVETAGDGPVEAWGLSVAEVTRAVLIGMRHGDRCFLLMNSFALDEVARWSPGEVLVYRVIEDCCRLGAARFDFGVGDARYKRSWADGEVPLAETLVPLTAGGRVAARLLRGRRRLRDAVVARPALRRVVQRVLRRGGGAEDGGGE